MEMLQLRYFYETAKTQSLTKTAQKFMVPTSSVSVTISKLEKELGVQLFDRSSNRIVLNENGKRFLKTASLIFSEIENAKYEFLNETKDTREIKILVLAMRGLITNYIIDFKKMYPDISFKTIFDFNETDYDGYDIIIGEPSKAVEGYESREILNTRLMIGAALNNPLLRKKLTLKQLENEPFVSMGEQNDMQKTLTRACQQVGFTPKIVVQCNDGSCFDKCIKEGVGIAVIRKRGEHTYSQGIAYLDVTDFDYPYSVCCFYKKQAYYGNVKKFIDFFAER